MTTAPVPSITDEQLAEIEQQCEKFSGFSVNSVLVEQLIARLRAAERDAERYRWMREQAAGNAETWQAVENAAFTAWSGLHHSFDMNIDDAMRTAKAINHD